MKNDVMQIRLSKEDKEIIKEACKYKNMSISEYVLNNTLNKAYKDIERHKTMNNTIERANATEGKIKQLKDKYNW